METTVTYARPELLQVADTVARDKGIDRDEVLEAMEQAIQKAAENFGIVERRLIAEEIGEALKNKSDRHTVVVRCDRLRHRLAESTLDGLALAALLKRSRVVRQPS